MKKLAVVIVILLTLLILSCTSTPNNTSSDVLFGYYNNETYELSNNNNTYTYDSTSQRVGTDIVLSFIGPQSVNANLYYDGKFIGTVETGKVFKTSIPDSGLFTFKAQIGDEVKILSLASRHSTEVEIKLSAKRSPLGIVFSEFSLVNRVPAIVRYVSVDGLNVRSNANADAKKLDTISQDCRVEILEEYTNSWLKIKYYKNKIGYVNGKYITTKKPRFVITSVIVENVDNNNGWITTAGNTLYSLQMRYLKPVAIYDSTFSENKTFLIRIVDPNGKISRNSLYSPKGFSFSNESQIFRGNNQTLYFYGWGNNTSSIYQAGKWLIEIWCSNKCLWVEEVIIK